MIEIIKDKFYRKEKVVKMNEKNGSWETSIKLTNFHRKVLIQMDDSPNLSHTFIPGKGRHLHKVKVQKNNYSLAFYRQFQDSKEFSIDEFIEGIKVSSNIDDHSLKSLKLRCQGKSDRGFLLNPYRESYNNSFEVVKSGDFPTLCYMCKFFSGERLLPCAVNPMYSKNSLHKNYDCPDFLYKK